jgi:hypothetical protein
METKTTNYNNTKNQQFMKKKQGLNLSSLVMLIAASMFLSYSGYSQVKYGDNLGNHKATTTLDLNTNNIKGIGSVLYGTSTIANLSGGGAIGTAVTTVDVLTVFAVNQTTSGQTLSLPTPTTATAGRVAIVSNSGTTSFTLHGLVIGAGQQAQYIYSGTAWLPGVASATNVPLSGLTAAIATNTIDNLNFAQNWNWNTATTGTQLALSANALTTGKLLGISGGASPLTTGNLLNVSGAVSSSTTGNGSGLINVTNTGASSSGTVATIQSNSTAGSGLTVLANGNVGIGTAAPKATLHNNGSTIIGASVTTNTDAPTGGNIGGLTASASVDIATVFTVTQTTAGKVLTLPAPTNTDAGRIATVIGGSGTVPFTMYGSTLSSGTALSLIWDGSAWHSTSAPSTVAVFNKSDVAIPAGTSAILANTANGGSVNTSTVITLAIPGVTGGDAITVNYKASEYTNTGWLSPGVNDGIVIISSVASASGTVKVTLANLAAGSTPSIDALNLTVTYQH